MNYITTHPDTVIEYRRSGMILHIYLDASYISEPEERSISGGYFLEPKYNTLIKVPWLASTTTFRPPQNASSMALGSRTCRVQWHRVGTGGRTGNGTAGGTDRIDRGGGERIKNGKRGAGWRRGGKRRGDGKRQPLVGSAKKYRVFYK